MIVSRVSCPLTSATVGRLDRLTIAGRGHAAPEDRPIQPLPVLVAARRLGWDTAEGLTLDISPVPSSPAQFASLRDGEIDVALTSPDNVLLYATTDKNPVGSRIPVVIHRGVDGGLGLGLVARPEISEPEGLVEVPVAVDVLQSGFAMLLKAMISRLGVDPARLTFVEEGATPKRADRLIEGAVGATILNAESRVRAEAQGMRVWSTSSDISKNYPGQSWPRLMTGPTYPRSSECGTAQLPGSSTPQHAKSRRLSVRITQN